MALSLPDVLRRFKADVAATLSATWIEQACARLGHTFRRRLLDPVTTVHLFLLQILHGNVACSALPHLSGLAFSAAAYAKARRRLPLALFEDLFERIVDQLFPLRQTTGLWHGHRTWLLDGSSFSMPDTEALQDYFGQPGAQKPGCGFPVAHILALFPAGTGFLQRVRAAPLRTHDLSGASRLHGEMGAGDVLVADRGLASFAHLALLARDGLFGVFRAHQRQIVNFRPGRRQAQKQKKKRGQRRQGQPTSRWLKRLGRLDQLVEYPRPKKKPDWLDEAAYQALPTTLVVRELRYTIHERGRRTRVVTLATTLLDAQAYPATELAKLYEQRWQVETNLRHLKTTMKMEVLHCKSVAGVHKELTMFALAYNLVRLVMLEASQRQRVPLERVSFVDALRWLRHATPGTPLPRLRVNPERVERHEPWVVKRRPKEFSRMTKPRKVLKQALEKKRRAA